MATWMISISVVIGVQYYYHQVTRQMILSSNNGTNLHQHDKKTKSYEFTTTADLQGQQIETRILLTELFWRHGGDESPRALDKLLGE